MSTDETYVYRFSGVVLPERALLDISTTFSMRLEDQGQACDLTYQIRASQISAIVRCARPIGNIYTLRNSIADAVRIILDSVGFLHGLGYQAEIRHVVMPQTDQLIVFGIGIPVLADFGKLHDLNLDNLLEVLGDERSRFVQMALRDLRQAIVFPGDSGFFVYRAIECLRQFFIAEGIATDDKGSWESLRESLRLSRDEIEYVKTFADPVRHGEIRVITDQERAKVLTSGWEAVLAFIQFARNGYQSLVSK